MLSEPEDVMASERNQPTQKHETSRVTTAGGAQLCLVARAQLPTRRGEFTIVAFENDRDGKDHIAILKGDIRGAQQLPLRIHSECLTGDVFSSMRCDCREQLEGALDALADSDQGAILYMRQEGRGIGLANKIRAYALQDGGLDTVDANLHLGFDDDMRDYDLAAGMIQLLQIQSVALMTNNPRKIEGLRAAGIEVSQRVPLQIKPNPHNVDYLRTKQRRSNHLLDLFTEQD